MHAKDKSCDSLQDFRPAAFSCEYSKNFRNNFFIEQLQWLFLNYILVSERFLKKDLLNFFITKYLKKEFDDDLTVGVDEHSPCGLCNWRHKDSSMSRDQKVMALLPTNGKVPYQLLSQRCFYCPNLITVAPL